MNYSAGMNAVADKKKDEKECRFWLTRNWLSVILRYSLTGAAPAEQQPKIKLGCPGETPKRPAPLWTVAYRLGPSFRGL